MYTAQTLIAPRKYVQGRGLLSSLGSYVEELGKDGLVIADEIVWGLVGKEVERSFAADTVFSYGVAAKRAAEEHVVTPAVEKIVEANTLLSGLGFESGGLAAAHAVHNGLTALPATHDHMHGDKVNFGTLTQLALEDRPTAEINDFISFCTQVGLPTTLEEVGLGGANRDQLMTVATTATMPGETIHNMPFFVDAEIVCDAMVAADAYGRAFRQTARAEEYATP